MERIRLMDREQSMTCPNEENTIILSMKIVISSDTLLGLLVLSLVMNGVLVETHSLYYHYLHYCLPYYLTWCYISYEVD